MFWKIWSSLLSAWPLYLKIWKNLCKAPLWYAKVLPKRYDEISWKPYTHMLLILALSFVKLLWPLREFFSYFHDQDSCAHRIPLAMLKWELVLYHPSTPRIKLHMCCDLSLQKYPCKRDIAYAKRKKKEKSCSKHDEKNKKRKRGKR
jgi:hypothetical protein